MDKKVEMKLAQSKEEASQKQQIERQKKLMVKHIPHDITQGRSILTLSLLTAIRANLGVFQPVWADGIHQDSEGEETLCVCDVFRVIKPRKRFQCELRASYKLC